MKRPERLWDQYYGKAEAEALRGCGIWPSQPHPCSLEPPWDQFDRHNLSLWDCMLNDWEAPWERGLLRRVMSFGSDRVHRIGQPIVLPEGPSFDGEKLIRIVIEQFPEDETTIPKAEEFLRSLPHLHRPVSFEIVGFGAEPKYNFERAQQILKEQPGAIERVSKEALEGWTEPYIVSQFVAHKRDASRIERQLTAHYPNSAVVAHDDAPFDLGSINSDINSDDGFADVLFLNQYYCWPLRLFTRLDPDPLGVAISAMENLGRYEWAILQILFQPATHPWHSTLMEAIADPYKEEFLLSDLDKRILREKFASPLFAVSIRIAAKKQDVIQQLAGWAHQFSRPPQEFGFARSIQELPNLAQSVGLRCTSRPGMLLNVEELASLVHLPGKSIVSERLRRVTSRTRPAAESKYERGSVLLGENVHRGKKQSARIPASLRSRHCYVAGASGTGKSTLLLNMILQDIQAGEGVGLLDPHGDLVKDVLRRVPKHRIDDVILFDPSDKEYPFALNILEASDADEREKIVSEMLMSIERYFPDGWGPRMERILSFTLYTVLDAIPGATLADVEQMLVDINFRQAVVMKCRTARYVQFWNQEFNLLPRNSVDPILNRLSVFLLNRTVRNIICQRRSAIDFDHLLNDGKILLANLSTGLLTEKIAGMFGSFLVTKIVSAAFRRAALPEHQRRPFFLYIDEFQAFMNLSVGFDRILAEARKYKLVLAGLANQYVGQLSQPVREAVFGNVGTMVTFRLGVNDARVIEKEMGVFTADEILNLEVGQAIVRAGASKTAFNVITSPPPTEPDADPTPRIIQLTRRKYATKLDAVDGDQGGQVATQSSQIGDPPQKRKQKKRNHRKPPQDDNPVDPVEDDLVT